MYFLTTRFFWIYLTVASVNATACFLVYELQWLNDTGVSHGIITSCIRPLFRVAWYSPPFMPITTLTLQYAALIFAEASLFHLLWQWGRSVLLLTGRLYKRSDRADGGRPRCRAHGSFLKTICLPCATRVSVAAVTIGFVSLLLYDWGMWAVYVDGAGENEAVVDAIESVLSPIGCAMRIGGRYRWMLIVGVVLCEATLLLVLWTLFRRVLFSKTRNIGNHPSRVTANALKPVSTLTMPRMALDTAIVCVVLASLAWWQNLREKTERFRQTWSLQGIYIFDQVTREEAVRNARVYLDDYNDLPTEFWNLVGLESLDLENMNVDTLPPEVGRLKRLESINLRCNQLTQLPAEFGELENVHNLHLDENRLTAFPREILSLMQLDLLDISGNPISAVPSDIHKLEKLNTLRLSNTSLNDAELMKLARLNGLRSLWISGGQITDQGVATLREALPECEINAVVGGSPSTTGPAHLD